MSGRDWVRRFDFEHAGVRGSIARLGPAWREIASHAEYPEPLAMLLGETVAASALFAGDIQLAGSLSIQLRAHGALKMLFAECTEQGELRGLAQFDESATTVDFAALGPDALLAITIDRSERNQRYQGLVPLEGRSLQQAFEAYFARSEQLPTAIHLCATAGACAGKLVQLVPGAAGAEAEFERVRALFATLRDGELLELPVETLLQRLFAEDDVRLHDASPLAFGCRCSRERVAAVLRSLGPEEAGAAAMATGVVEVRCEFCNRVYRFDAVDIAQVFLDRDRPPGPVTPQ